MKRFAGIAAAVASALALTLAAPGPARPLAVHAQTAPAHKSFTVHSPLRTAPAPGRTGRVRPAANAGGPAGHIPCDLTNAYYAGGSGVDGTGVTIAIIDAFDQPNITGDLLAFDAEFGLSNPTFNKYEQGVNFGVGTPPMVDPGWGREISLDVEWSHVIAPNAAIALVEAQSSNSVDILLAVDYAVQVLHADVVSMSFTVTDDGTQNFTDFVNASDFHFPATGPTSRPVVYVAAAGDGFFQNNWPAESSHVVGIGGTSVNVSGFGGLSMSNPGSPRVNCAGALSPGVTSANETVWGTGGPGVACCGGTGGGKDTAIAKPAWQTLGPAGGRTIPDVAALADPATGVAVYDTSTYTDCTGSPSSGWDQCFTGGTSLSAPLWAGVLALVDQRATALGAIRFNVTATVNQLYMVPAADYNDITVGNSPPSPVDACLGAGTCVAQAGYDMVTGRGSPKISSIVTPLAPGPPVAPAAVAGDRAAQVSWGAAPANGAAIDTYTVTCVGAVCPSPVTVAGSQLSAVVSGLANNSPYSFTVAATNAVGKGPAAASNTITPTSRLAGIVPGGSVPTAGGGNRVEAVPLPGPTRTPAPRVSAPPHAGTAQVSAASPATVAPAPAQATSAPVPVAAAAPVAASCDPGLPGCPGYWSSGAPLRGLTP